MELPRNGGIVIIDDQIREAIPLMNALSQKGVSYVYYNGEIRNYPKETLESVRLIFLDMHLDNVSGVANDNKSVVSTLIAGIDTIVSDNNGPYVIMVWSKHDSQHLTDFKKGVLEKNGLQCKPVAVLNMDKSSCFESVYEKGEGSAKSEFKLKENGIEILLNTMEEQLKSIDAFVLLYNWENGVRLSAKETVNKIESIYENQSSQWSANLKNCFSNMAKAYAGKMLDETNKAIIENTYYSMNDIMCDYNFMITDSFSEKVKEISCEHEERNGVQGKIEIIENIDGKEYVLSHTRNQYYLYVDSKMISSGKNVEKVFENIGEEHKLAETKIKMVYWNGLAGINSLLHLREYVPIGIRPGNIYEIDDGLKKELCDTNPIDLTRYDEIKGIELEVSPICDYSQKKRMRLRLLPGLLLPQDINLNAEYLYITKPMLIEGDVKKMMFDFRYFTSEKEGYLKGKKHLYVLGDELLRNIKDKMSSHIVRTGVVVME